MRGAPPGIRRRQRWRIGDSPARGLVNGLDGLCSGPVQLIDGEIEYEATGRPQAMDEMHECGRRGEPVGVERFPRNQEPSCATRPARDDDVPDVAPRDAATGRP